MANEGLITLVASDLLPDLEFTFDQEDDDGVITPVPLTLFSSILLRMRRSDGILISIEHTVDDAAAGEGHFEWSTGDLIQGLHLAEIRRITVAGALPQTFPSKMPLILDLRDLV